MKKSSHQTQNEEELILKLKALVSLFYSKLNIPEVYRMLEKFGKF